MTKRRNGHSVCQRKEGAAMPQRQVLYDNCCLVSGA